MAVAVLFGAHETSQLRRFKHAPGRSAIPPIADVLLRRSEPPPALQEESDVKRSVRVQPCIRPIVAWRITSVAMQPQWPLALM
jgi:hypothetical protein